MLGFFLGMRHATDADHVVAVAAIVSRERTTRSALGIGGLWGLGHSATILAFGGAIILFGLVIPPHIGLSMEMSVAAMLVILGVMNVTGAMRTIDEAAHSDRRGAVETPISTRRRLSRFFRPLLIGVVHGLAGSAAVALLVLATIREPAWALLYLVIFGAGTVAGMMLLTAAMVVPLTVLTRFGSGHQILARVTGLVSIAFGLLLAYKVGFVDGLFTAILSSPF
jgi:high-affinity nickel-transport protein